MKKMILLLLIPFFGLTQNNKLDEVDGFEEFVFGTSPHQYKNLTLEIDDGNTKLYSCVKTNTKIEGLQIENMNITFNKDKLSVIALKTKNSTGVKYFWKLKELYGEPKKSNKVKGNYDWSCSKITLSYEENIGNDALITFYCKSIK